jgi:hypothetical protein
MRGLLFLALVAALHSPAADRKKPPDVQVIEMKAVRQDGLVMLDGRVRNSGEKPVQELKMVFEFLTAENTGVTTQNTTLEEEVLAPGSEASFHVEMPDPVRAVRYRVGAFSKGERELNVGNAGPFLIE